jgi:hypothetical protein
VEKIAYEGLLFDYATISLLFLPLMNKKLIILFHFLDSLVEFLSLIRGIEPENNNFIMKIHATVGGDKFSF